MRALQEKAERFRTNRLTNRNGMVYHTGMETTTTTTTTTSVYAFEIAFWHDKNIADMAVAHITATSATAARKYLESKINTPEYGYDIDAIDDLDYRTFGGFVEMTAQ